MKSPFFTWLKWKCPSYLHYNKNNYINYDSQRAWRQLNSESFCLSWKYSNKIMKRKRTTKKKSQAPVSLKNRRQRKPINFRLCVHAAKSNWDQQSQTGRPQGSHDAAVRGIRECWYCRGPSRTPAEKYKSTPRKVRAPNCRQVLWGALRDSWTCALGTEGRLKIAQKWAWRRVYFLNVSKNLLSKSEWTCVPW